MCAEATTFPPMPPSARNIHRPGKSSDLNDQHLNDQHLNDLDLDDLDLDTSCIQNPKTYAHLANMHTFQAQGEALRAMISRDPLP